MIEPPYSVEFLAHAEKDLERLDKPVIARVLKKLRRLAESIELVEHEALTGSLVGLSKLRVGDYRVIYESDRKNRILTIHMVGHRKEIYKQR